MTIGNYQNKNYIGNDGLIHHEYFGDQTSETVEEDIRRLAGFIDTLHKQNKSAYLLLDFTNVTKQDSGARSKAYKALKTLQYDKMAFFGMSHFLKYVAKFVVATTGMGPKVGSFGTEEEAVKWLKE